MSFAIAIPLIIGAGFGVSLAGSRLGAPAVKEGDRQYAGIALLVLSMLLRSVLLAGETG